MKIFVSRPTPDLIVLFARAEGPNGVLGDMVQEVRAGESMFGKSFDEWIAAHRDSNGAPVEINV